MAEPLDVDKSQSERNGDDRNSEQEPSPLVKGVYQCPFMAEETLHNLNLSAISASIPNRFNFSWYGSRKMEYPETVFAKFFLHSQNKYACYLVPTVRDMSPAMLYRWML